MTVIVRINQCWFPKRVLLIAEILHITCTEYDYIHVSCVSEQNKMCYYNIYVFEE